MDLLIQHFSVNYNTCAAHKIRAPLVNPKIPLNNIRFGYCRSTDCTITAVIGWYSQPNSDKSVCGTLIVVRVPQSVPQTTFLHTNGNCVMMQSRPVTDSVTDRDLRKKNGVLAQ